MAGLHALQVSALIREGQIGAILSLGVGEDYVICGEIEDVRSVKLGAEDLAVVQFREESGCLGLGVRRLPVETFSALLVEEL